MNRVENENGRDSCDIRPLNYPIGIILLVFNPIASDLAFRRLFECEKDCVLFTFQNHYFLKRNE